MTKSLQGSPSLLHVFMVKLLQDGLRSVYPWQSVVMESEMGLPMVKPCKVV